MSTVRVMRLGPRVWLFGQALLVLLVASPAPGAEQLDCRYQSYGTEQSIVDQGSAEGIALPDNDLFRPLLADQREPRFYADYRHIFFRDSDVLAEGKGDDINAALVAFGGSFGVWGLRQPRGCDGFQVNLFGAVFAQFNLHTHSRDLLNADYLVGPTLTFRQGRWSGRLRVYHQSSHLGDEFLLNFGLAHGVQRRELSFEIVDALFSAEDTWWRLLAGGGLVVLSSADPDLTTKPAFLQWGLELRGPEWQPWAWLKQTRLRAVAGGNFLSVEAAGWTVNTSVNAGLEWASPAATHRIRMLAVYQRAALLFSQFFTDKAQNVGAQLQFEF
ncbi:MAG: DUF1207 domain-containing protein [Myxococcales bacterium]